MVSKKTLNTLLCSAVALTLAGVAGSASANDDAAASTDKEKCYGVVKAGHNDCASASKSHSCAGQAATDGSGDEWVALPAGTCDKLTNGSLTAAAAAAPDAAAAAPAATDPEAAADAPAAQ